jgi:hypothetical protein
MELLASASAVASGMVWTVQRTVTPLVKPRGPEQGSDRSRESSVRRMGEAGTSRRAVETDDACG